uniref:AB hydrolase-1 domain-containing protein n=1 Tax=Manihot esculenta TaxID=3983 RepID=A0A2C9V8D5_MANES
MAGGVNRKISAASARAHTRRAKQNNSLKLPPGIFSKILLLLLVGILAWAYQVIRPPPPKICGSPDGPPVTASRIKLRDGRHLAYKEHGVTRDLAKFKIIVVHGFRACRHNPSVANHLSPEIVKELGVYLVSFDRPGYGESDPHPKRTLKSLALDIEELADQLGLGSKFYVIGYSMGGELTWSCLKYIPHRLAGVTLLAPVINYWWPGFPANQSNEAYNQQFAPDQWALRVAHYTPWLTYWWNTQKWFSGSTVMASSPDLFSHQDKEVLAKLSMEKSYMEYMTQQGEYESLHRDMMIAFGSWEFDPMDLDNPFPNNEGSVHLWQGDEDRFVPVMLQRYIAQRLPWIHYHELPGSGHLFPFIDRIPDKIIKAMLTEE